MIAFACKDISTCHQVKNEWNGYGEASISRSGLYEKHGFPFLVIIDDYKWWLINSSERKQS